MSEPRIVIATFDAAQILDVTGPLEVFSTASRFLESASYRTDVVTTGGGPVTASCGLEFASSPIARRHRPRGHVDGGRRRGHPRRNRGRGAASSRPTARNRCPPRHLRLLRCLRPCRRWSAGGSPRHHPLGRMQAPRGPLRGCHRRRRRHLRPGRQRVDLGRCHRRHRPRPRPRRRRPRTQCCRHGCPATRRLPPEVRWTGPVLRRAGRAGRRHGTGERPACPGCATT